MTFAAKSNKQPKIVNSKIRSSAMDTSRFRWHKTPTPAADGMETVFTLPDGEAYVSGLLEVFVDGVMQTKDVHYSETTSSTFTMVTAPDADEDFWVNYIKQ